MPKWSNWWKEWYNKQPPMSDSDLWYHCGAFRVNEDAKPGECLFKPYKWSPSERYKICDICVIPKLYGCAIKRKQDAYTKAVFSGLDCSQEGRDEFEKHYNATE